jgi:hypothetical protein
MSTIPTINPAITMNNMHSKSKTTLASGGPGFGALAQKNNKSKISPFKAD